MLLDTCALLWLAQGGGKLSRAALRRIECAPVVYVSAISAFEISLKQRHGKLVLPASPGDWFRMTLAHHGLHVLPIDLGIALRAAELPLIHRDPCDRFVVATAETMGLPVVTADPYIARYGVEVVS